MRFNDYIVTMTNWQPDLLASSKPRYLAIVETLAADVSAGRLKPGDRLPTHRDLAWKLKVTVGTVTRAYAEAERRGLISGEVGRGTFIRDRGADSVMPPAAPSDADGFVDLSRNFPPTDRNDRTVADIVAQIASSGLMPELLRYQPNLGMPAHRTAAATWLARSGMTVEPSRVAVTAGAQHAMMLAMSAVAKPGDVILTEQLTFYGMKSVAAMLSLKLHGVAMDSEGLMPDALDAACRQLNPKALYCIPTLQNPTAAMMPAERRAAIAEICRRNNVVIVEDDIYSFLPDRTPPPLASFAPDHSIFVTSLSKCAGPGLRIGFLAAAPALIERIGTGLRASMWMAPPLMAEVAARLIRDGGLDRLVAWQRREATRRQDIARETLGNAHYDSHPRGFHIWLHLPEPWRREEFTAEARRRGLGVAPAEVFAVGRAPVPHAARICLSAATDHGQLRRALEIVASLSSSPMELGSPMV